MNRVTRGEKILANLVEHDVITEESRAFLTAALDPFHDTRIPHLQGWPDGTTDPSVVRCVKQSMTITAPLGDGQPVAWDCLINTNPILNRRTVETNSVGGRSGNALNIVPLANSSYGLACVNIDRVEAGQGNNYAQIHESNFSNKDSFQLPDEWCTGKGRLVGMGVEVHNVTPELYKGGTCTVGRYPQAVRDPFTAYHWKRVDYATTPPVAAYETYAFSAIPIEQRPNTIAEAMYLEGTRQWEAEKGCYVVVPFEDHLNPVTNVDYLQPWLMPLDEEVVDDVNTHNVMTVWPGESDLAVGYPANKWTPTSSTFIYFTGLPKESVLTININLYYESFPTQREVDIVTLASPSSPYDVHALELYKHCLAHLPVGVPVAWNGLGDWFAMAVSEFSDLAGLGLSALGVPFAQQLAAGAKGLANNYLKSQVKLNPAAAAEVKQLVSSRKKAKAKKRAAGVPTPAARK